MKMELKIYRKRAIPYGYVFDDEPIVEYGNISSYEIKSGYILAIDSNGETETILIDTYNYKYIISLQEN